MHNIAKTFFPILLLLFAAVVTAQNGKNNVGNAQRIWLDSEIGHQGDYQWKMIKAGDATDPGEKISLSNYATANWMPAIVPGTVLNSLVYNQKYPEPYYGINNKIESKLIPDISETGRDFYTYWFRTDYHKVHEQLFLHLCYFQTKSTALQCSAERNYHLYYK